MSKVTSGLPSVPHETLESRVQHVLNDLRALSGALDLMINKADAAEDHDLWGFCMLLSDSIDNVMLNLCSIKESAELVERSAYRKGGAA
jgi:hypothetical protein